MEAHRDLPDVIPTKTMGQVTKHEVKQVLKSSGLPVEHLQEAAAAIDACISDKSYDPFEVRRASCLIHAADGACC